ncbi:MAG: AmmeMemoRadiSam system radical SAM enzyme [Verrucomicrobiae bacterium]|nr:AmmeMemoRadiSam system radical SAM enzyme [Verrucomicrobiae bacterium]MDW8344986.1 AmmeMemoRadiSam system radical SAM enzyme [Verrucomicrobiae bacterium]
MAVDAPTLGELLAELTRPGELYERLPQNRVRCYACGHRCLILDGRDGICRVRFNRGGTLYVPWGYFAGVQCDPIEKKPFFHVLPGSLAMSFGMLGCDLHCGYCQNWVTSQALRDPISGVPPSPMTPAQFVELAVRYGARTVTSTYNEPLITSEWAVEVFRHARQRGLHTSYVSNGNATAEVLDYLRPWVDFYKIDLKSFNDRHYRELGGTLDRILDGIRMVHAKGFWLEVVTLLVPGFNDSDDEIRQMARFLANISPDIPWHCTAFHPDYKMTDRDATPAATLMRACEIGREEGLHFVYAGNLPGRVGNWENTICPDCGELLVERRGFRVTGYHLLPGGLCPNCHRRIPGFWDERCFVEHDQT